MSPLKLCPQYMMADSFLMMNNNSWQPFALLLIDVQRDFFPETVQQAFPQFEENVAALLRFCRRQRIEVVHVRASFKADGSDWMVRYKVIDRRLPCIEGTPGVEVLPCARAQSGEKVIIKQCFDAFLNPELRDYLHGRNKRFVLVSGLITSVCVLTTAAAAAQRGYLTAVVEDCCADAPDRHDAVLSSYPFIFDRVNSGDIGARLPEWSAYLEKIAVN